MAGSSPQARSRRARRGNFARSLRILLDPRADRRTRRAAARRVTALDETHDPRAPVVGGERRTTASTDFPVQDLPLASSRRAGEIRERARTGVGIGDQILDVEARRTGQGW